MKSLLTLMLLAFPFLSMSQTTNEELDGDLNEEVEYEVYSGELLTYTGLSYAKIPKKRCINENEQNPDACFRISLNGLKVRNVNTREVIDIPKATILMTTSLDHVKRLERDFQTLHHFINNPVFFGPRERSDKQYDQYNGMFKATKADMESKCNNDGNDPWKYLLKKEVGLCYNLPYKIENFIFTLPQENQPAAIGFDVLIGTWIVDLGTSTKSRIKHPPILQASDKFKFGSLNF